MNRVLKNRPLWAVLVILTTLFTLFFILFNPAFDTNDDFAMMSIVNGFYYGEPLPHLIFTNITIGLILKFLYTLTSTISWYALYLYLIHFISLLLSVYTFWVSKKGGMQFIFFISSISMFEVPMLMNLQFTTTSLFLGFSAVLYYFALTKENKGNIWVAIISGTLLGTVSFIRTKSFLGILAFSFPLLLYAIKYFSVRKNTVFALCALSIFFLSNLTTNLYYSLNPDWRNYFEFNKIRGSLHETPLLSWDKNTKSILSKINWSENDFLMFVNWFYTDRKIYSTEALQTFTKYRHLEAPLALSIKKTFVALSQSFSGELIYILILLIFLLLMAQNKKIFFILMLLFWYLIVIFYLINFVRFPPRIAIPSFLFVSLSLVLCSEIKPLVLFQKTRVSTRFYNLIIITYLILFIKFSPLYKLFDDSKINASNHREFMTILQTLKTLNPEGTFISWAASLKYDECSPFVDKTTLPQIKLIGLGWRVNSPPYFDWLRKLKIDDLYEAIATRNDIYLIAREDLVQLYEKYMLEHYGKEVKLKSLLTLYDSDENIEESEKVKVFHNLS